MARRICLAAVAAILLFVTMAAVGYSSEQEGNDVVPTPVNRGTGARVLRANLTTNPITVDPAKAVAESELLLVRTLFDTLVEYQDGNIKPAIADSWLYSDDGKELYIQLRSDAKFSNGKPITSSDVEFSLERILDSNTASPYAVLLAPYLARGAASDAVEPIDERSLVIRFPSPVGFPRTLRTPSFSIVSEENVQNYNFGHAGTLELRCLLWAAVP